MPPSSRKEIRSCPTRLLQEPDFCTRASRILPRRAGIVVTSPTRARVDPTAFRCPALSRSARSRATPAARIARVARTNASFGRLSWISFMVTTLRPPAADPTQLGGSSLSLWKKFPLVYSLTIPRCCVASDRGRNRAGRQQLTMPSGRSFYQRSPERYAAKKQQFQQIISELKRLASKKGYTQGQIASEAGVSPITVNHWQTGHSLTAQRKSIERLRTLLAGH